MLMTRFDRDGSAALDYAREKRRDREWRRARYQEQRKGVNLHEVARKNNMTVDCLRGRLRTHPEWTLADALAFDGTPRARKSKHYERLGGKNPAAFARERQMSLATLRRRLDAHPEWTLDEIVAGCSARLGRTYRDRLGMSATDFAFNHGVNMEAVTRALREHPEWTPAQVAAYCKTRRQPPRRVGMGHHAAKLTDAQVLEIRRRHAAGEKQCTLAVAFDVKPNTISRVVRYRAWTHVTEPQDDA